MPPFAAARDWKSAVFGRVGRQLMKAHVQQRNVMCANLEEMGRSA
jgi:hypothetical protein